MIVTVPDVMRRVRNYFLDRSIHREWLLEGGVLYPRDMVAPGTWIAIADGPVHGVYQLDENGAIPNLPDRQWTGTIHLLAPTPAFLRLCGEIADWADKHDPTLTSERLGQYSHSHAPAAWESVFTAALAPYMRMYPEVKAD